MQIMKNPVISLPALRQPAWPALSPGDRIAGRSSGNDLGPPAEICGWRLLLGGPVHGRGDLRAEGFTDVRVCKGTPQSIIRFGSQTTRWTSASTMCR